MALISEKNEERPRDLEVSLFLRKSAAEEKTRILVSKLLT